MSDSDTKTKDKPQAKLSDGEGRKLLAHIVQRTYDGGPLKDKALCGALWDRVFNKGEVCPKCLEVAERDGHDWRAR